LLLAGCGTPPQARETPPPAPIQAPAPPAPDPCLPVDGKPPAPVARSYSGVLKAARCQPEVLQLMQDVSRALGVDCSYCHDPADYTRTTPKKEIANWMASELMPRLANRSGKPVTCADCHADDGRGKARILGAPRSRQRAVEWMNTVLVERFDAAAGGRLFCATCHVGQLGSSAFQGRVILTDHLPPLPAGHAPEVTPDAVPDAGAPAPGVEASPHDVAR
jgi:formate-dependent nitrite reductase cytochrome c552 subunit